MKYKIVLIKFPLVEKNTAKYRPALCITNEIGRHKTIICAFISTITDEKEILNTDIVLKTTEVEFNQTGLKYNSAIKLHRLITITKDKIVGEFGNLPNSFHQLVIQNFNNIVSQQ